MTGKTPTLYLSSSSELILVVANPLGLVFNLYDSVENAKKCEPKYRLIRNGREIKEANEGEKE